MKDLLPAPTALSTSDVVADVVADAIADAAPAGSTFLIGVEVCLWTVYLCGAIMVMVVVMMQ